MSKNRNSSIDRSNQGRQIIQKLRNSYVKLRTQQKLAALFVALLSFFSGLAFVFYVDIIGFQSEFIKTGIFICLISISTLLSVVLYRKLVAGSFTDFYRSFAQFTGNKTLLNAIDLFLHQENDDSLFYEAALEDNLKTISFDWLDKQLANYQSSQTTYRAFTASSGLLALSAFIMIFSYLTNPEHAVRSITFWDSYDQPNPYEYSIEPGDIVVQHGSSFAPSVNFKNELPKDVFFSFKTRIEDEFRQRSMSEIEPGVFIAQEMELTNDITYFITMDNFESDRFSVDVQLQPRFDELTVVITPPSYTELEKSEFSYPFSEINPYRGSEVHLKGISNKELDSAIFVKGDEQSELKFQDGFSFSATFEVTSNDTANFIMTDREGLTNRNPFRFFINPRDDEYPTVIIEEPTGTLSMSDPSTIEITYLLTDDFGLTRSTLYYEVNKAFVDEPLTASFELPTPLNGQKQTFTWKTDNLNLTPRDQVTFWIRVWDNDEYNGSKWSESQRVEINVPSLADSFEELDNKEKSVQSELDEISDNFSQMEQEYEEFLERLKQNPDGGFDEKMMIEEISEKQTEIDEAVQKLNDQFQQLREDIQQNDSISEETRQSYRELQQLMDELDDPALKEALDKLREAMENMRPQDIEQALENVSFNEQNYKERLERTLELFKQLKMNSDIDKLAKQYEDLAERMNESKEGNMKQLQNELDTIEEDFEQLSEQLEQLGEDPPKRAEENLKKLKEEAKQELENISQQFDQLREDAEKQNQNGEMQPGDEMQQMQDQISEQLQEEADKLRESMQQMSGQQLNVNILALQRALYNLLLISDEQEYVTMDASETRNRSQGFVELARDQQNIRRQFSAVADTIFQVSSEIPGVPNQINRKKNEIEKTLKRATSEMAERNQRGALITSRESLGGINDLTSTLASLIDQLLDQQGGGGAGGAMSMQQMMQQLEQMSGDQQMLNQQLQEMINDIQGDRLNQEQSERLDQLAKQQNEIRKQLRELQRSGALEHGDRVLGDMERMIEEMEESILDMRGGITDPLMNRRQQNILSRMLSAQEAIQQRGEKDEREGTPGNDYDQSLPPEITLEELRQEIRSRLQDPNYTKFSEEYEQLIERYFDLLQRFENQQIP